MGVPLLARTEKETCTGVARTVTARLPGCMVMSGFSRTVSCAGELVKADIREPAVYAGLLALLLGWRLLNRRRGPARRAAPRREGDAREDQRTADSRPRINGLVEQPPAQH